MGYDRPKFLRWLKDFIEKANVKVMDRTPGSGDIIIVTRVKDFDMKSNSVWEIPANKSYPRDVNCGWCGEQVVMSDGMFELYEKNKRTSRVQCGKCLISDVNL